MPITRLEASPEPLIHDRPIDRRANVGKKPEVVDELVARIKAKVAEIESGDDTPVQSIGKR
jgi:hypothetical protein